MNYNFVSNGKDDLKDAAFFVDANIGYSQAFLKIRVILQALEKKYLIGRDGHHREGNEEDRGHDLYQV